MKRLAWLLVLILAAVGAGAGALYLRASEPYQGFHGSEQFVDIPQGAGSRAIGERLVAAGVVRDHPTFRAALFQSGFFIFKTFLQRCQVFRFFPQFPFKCVNISVELLQLDKFPDLVLDRYSFNHAD